MNTTVEQYIASQPLDRQSAMTNIHSIILRDDSSVVALVEPMMGKEMIIYKAKGFMKYGLAGMKNYMSLHVLPIYCNPLLIAKYKELLPKAKFQKGCINFETSEEMPMDVVGQLITDSAQFDLLKFREAYQKQKKEKAKAKGKV